MIGPSSGSSSSAEAPGKRQQQHHRALLDELDIESICDEVCGHQHPRGQAAKRPRFLAELSAGAAQLLEHEALALPSDDVFAPYFAQAHQPQLHQLHQQQQLEGGAEAPVAKLEVLLVDGTWDDALESLQAASQPCHNAVLADLTTGHSLQASQQHDLASLQAVNYQNTYWSPQSHSQQTTPPAPIQPQPQPRQQRQIQQQQQQHQAMPKVHHHSADNNGSSSSRHQRAGGLATAPLSAAANYEDQENGNLSWLLDFKLDSFIEAPEDKATLMLNRDFQGSRSKPNGSNSCASIGKSSQAERKACNYEATRCNGGHSPSAACGSSLDSRKAQLAGPKKPPFTYTELIEHALQERGELTVSAIYQWISERFPYYKSNDDRWKNSVRHNLSINPHFRKGSKAPHGAGHLWAIASQDDSKPRQLFNIATIRQALRNEEAAAAAAKASKAELRRPEPIDEVAAATASISEPVEEEEEADIVDAITLEHCAEQILSGIKKEVEVQYLVPMMVSSAGDAAHGQACQPMGPITTTAEDGEPLCSVKDAETAQQSLKISLPNFPDFLNPVSKEVVAEECGLLGESYLVTDLNPTSLGLSLAESEVVSSDNLFGEELSFQFYEFASAASSQLQSA